MEEAQDELLNFQILDEVRKIVGEGDDGTGERLLWVIERIEYEFYDMLEAKKIAYQTMISKQIPLSKARYSADPVDFEVSLILSYFPIKIKRMLRRPFPF